MLLLKYSIYFVLSCGCVVALERYSCINRRSWQIHPLVCCNSSVAEAGVRKRSGVILLSGRYQSSSDLKCSRSLPFRSTGESMIL